MEKFHQSLFLGPDVGPRLGPGEGPGVGPGESPCVGPGEGLCVGPGVGPGVSFLRPRSKLATCLTGEHEGKTAFPQTPVT